MSELSQTALDETSKAGIERLEVIEPSAELRATYLELTAALVRVEGILRPIAAVARAAHARINVEATAKLPVQTDTSAEGQNSYSALWMEFIDLAEGDMSPLLASVCDLLREFTPGSELP